MIVIKKKVLFPHLPLPFSVDTILLRSQKHYKITVLTKLNLWCFSNRHWREWKEHLHQTNEDHTWRRIHSWGQEELCQTGLPEHLHVHAVDDPSHGGAPYIFLWPPEPGIWHKTNGRSLCQALELTFDSPEANYIIMEVIVVFVCHVFKFSTSHIHHKRLLTPDQAVNLKSAGVQNTRRTTQTPIEIYT